MAYSWKNAEKDFVESWKRFGKRAVCIRLTDTAAAKAVAGTRAFVAAQPSDYIVTWEGRTFFAEVKSTTDERAFHFKHIRKQQIAAARRITKAGGEYLFFICRIRPDGQDWFLVPAQVVIETIPIKKHLTWSELSDYAYGL